MKNTLTLKTERLAELTSDELHAVAGAAISTLPCFINTPATLHGCTTADTCP